MGESGSARQYHYFSDRLVKEFAEANRIDLEKRSFAWKIPLVGLFGGGEFGRSDRVRPKFRDEVAEEVKAALGARAVHDFVTPSQVRFARGVGRMDFGYEPGSDMKRGFAKMHTRVIGSDERQTDVCLFGGVGNYLGFTKAEKFEHGWASSAWPWIEQLLKDSADRRSWSGADGPYDAESIAVEAVKILRDEGFDGYPALQRDLPETRAFTLADGTMEWLAVIYHGIELTKDRWHWYPDDESLDRILIGAPLWVRTAEPGSLTVYSGRHRAEGRRQLASRRRELAAREEAKGTSA